MMKVVLPALAQAPEIVEHPVAAIPLRGREDDVRAGFERPHEQHVAGENVKERQRAHDAVGLLEQQPVGEPSVVDHARVAVLHEFRQPGGSAGVEIGGDPILLHVLEVQGFGLLGDGRGEVDPLGRVAGRVLGAHERDDPALGRLQVAVEIDLDNGVHLGRLLDRLGHLLGEVGLGEWLERDHDLGVGLAQDGADVVGLEQRVDRVGDARDHRAEQGEDGLSAVRHHQSDNVLLADPEAAQQIRRLADLAVQFLPGQGLGRIFGSGEKLVAQRPPVGKGGRGVENHLMHRAWALALLPRHLVFNILQFLQARK